MASITIQDISRQLGISIATASKALNGYPDVSEETRLKVLELARELNYQPSHAARNLRRKRTENVGLLLSYPINYISEYMAELITGILQATEQHGYNVMLFAAAANNPDLLRKICRGREIDGLILRGPAHFQPLAQILQEENMPYLVIGRRSELPNVSYIVPDNRGGAVELMRHLLAMGHRRIAYITRPELGESDIDRKAGYQDVLAGAGISYDQELIAHTSSANEPASLLEIERLFDLPDRPTAIFGVHDVVAISAMNIAAQRGLRVPEDVAIAGFDGITSTQITKPPLTTVRQPLPEIGRQAFEMLYAQMTHKRVLPEARIVPVDLVIRQSTQNR